MNTKIIDLAKSKKFTEFSTEVKKELNSKLSKNDEFKKQQDNLEIIRANKEILQNAAKDLQRVNL